VKHSHEDAPQDGHDESDAVNAFSRFFGDVRKQQREFLEARIDTVLSGIKAEVLKAYAKHAPMHSAHEGYAVLQEEVDELWDEIKADRGVQQSGLQEAIQVGAMAVRYMVDLFNWEIG
jgi:hypothetical protein